MKLKLILQYIYPFSSVTTNLGILYYGNPSTQISLLYHFLLNGDCIASMSKSAFGDDFLSGLLFMPVSQKVLVSCLTLISLSCPYFKPWSVSWHITSANASTCSCLTVVKFNHCHVGYRVSFRVSCSYFLSF